MNESNVIGVYDRADLYRAMYEGRKDYARESQVAIDHIRLRNPHARRLLDVACGTGSHLRHFAAAFDEVGGLDLTEQMLRLARARLPGVPFWRGDMRKFDLGRTFDAITCMFSSVGYLADTAELEAALGSFARHLTPGGVVVIEPWWSPDTFLPGWVQGDVVRADGRTICRASHSVRAPDRMASRMEVHWVVADAEAGISCHTDVHVMTLFSQREYLDAFAGAGFTAEFVDRERHGLSGPGLYVGVLGGG